MRPTPRRPCCGGKKKSSVLRTVVKKPVVTSKRVIPYPSRHPKDELDTKHIQSTSSSLPHVPKQVKSVSTPTPAGPIESKRGGKAVSKIPGEKGGRVVKVKPILRTGPQVVRTRPYISVRKLAKQAL